MRKELDELLERHAKSITELNKNGRLVSVWFYFQDYQTYGRKVDKELSDKDYIEYVKLCRNEGGREAVLYCNYISNDYSIMLF
jgi:hypothetical protein